MTFAIRAALAAAVALAPLGLAAQDPVPLAHQNGILIEDSYAVSAGAMAKTGAAFMRITNETAADDRLIGVRSAAAARAELHMHAMDDGIARMRRVEDGVPLAAGATVTLERGGLHVMFLGLAEPFADGAAVELTLVFDRAGEIPVRVPVDLARRTGVGEGAAHGPGH